MKHLLVFVVAMACWVACAPVEASESAATGTAQIDGIIDNITGELWKQTDQYWHLGDYPRIIALNRIIVNAKPHFVDAYTNAGWLMESIGFTSDAEAFYQEAVRRNPQSSDAYYSLGMFYYHVIRDYQAAEAVFGQDVTNSPKADVNDWKMLAHTYEREGRLDEAVATWQEIKRRWPNGPAVATNLNRILAEQHAAPSDLRPDSKSP